MFQRLRNRSGPEVLGSCHGCGRCCRSLTLVDGGRPIRTMRQFEALVRRQPEYRFFLPHGVAEEDGFLHFSCLLLDADGRCSDYERRPDICRDYPNPMMFRFGAVLLDGCGYHPAPERSFAQLYRSERRRMARRSRLRRWWLRLLPRLGLQRLLPTRG